MEGRVQAEPGPTDATCSRAAPSEAGAPQSSGKGPPRGLYPACLRRSRVKMVSMLSASLRGLQAGRYLPVTAPPEELDLDSLLVLSASQSCGLPEEEEHRATFVSGWWLEEVMSEERTAAGREEEEEEERGRLWMMLLMVSLKSRRRLVDDEEDEGLGR